MNKIIEVGIIFLISLNIAFATYTCEETCEIELPDCYDGECSGMAGDELTVCMANCNTIYDICILTCGSGECMSNARVWEAECLIYFCTDAEPPPPLPIRPVWGLDNPPYSDCASDNCYTTYQWMVLDCGAEGLPYLYDSDSDGIFDIYEDLDESNSFNNDDTDGDGIPDYADSDDDGDGIPTADENPDPNGDGNPNDALNSDGDSIPDYLDPDVIEEEPECLTDDDCYVGYICSDESCIAGCRIDDDCEEDEECILNVCIPEEPIPECEGDTDCPSGFECIYESCVEIEIEEESEDETLEVPIPVRIPPCIETDNGQDYISQGTILSGIDKNDKCVNSDKLRERYCITKSAYTAEDVSCSGLYGSNWGCEEGECIELKSSSYWWLIMIILIVVGVIIFNQDRKGGR